MQFGEKSSSEVVAPRTSPAARSRSRRKDAANVEVLGWPLTDTANPLLFHSQLKVDLGTAVSSAGRLPPLTPVRAVPVAQV